MPFSLPCNLKRSSNGQYFQNWRVWPPRNLEGGGSEPWKVTLRSPNKPDGWDDPEFVLEEGKDWLMQMNEVVDQMRKEYISINYERIQGKNNSTDVSIREECKRIIPDFELVKEMQDLLDADDDNDNPAPFAYVQYIPDGVASKADAERHFDEVDDEAAEYLAYEAYTWPDDDCTPEKFNSLFESKSRYVDAVFKKDYNLLLQARLTSTRLAQIKNAYMRPAAQLTYPGTSNPVQTWYYEPEVNSVVPIGWKTSDGKPTEDELVQIKGLFAPAREEMLKRYKETLFPPDDEMIQEWQEEVDDEGGGTVYAKMKVLDFEAERVVPEFHPLFGYQMVYDSREPASKEAWPVVLGNPSGGKPWGEQVASIYDKFAETPNGLGITTKLLKQRHSRWKQTKQFKPDDYENTSLVSIDFLWSEDAANEKQLKPPAGDDALPKQKKRRKRKSTVEHPLQQALNTFVDLQEDLLSQQKAAEKEILEKGLDAQAEKAALANVRKQWTNTRNDQFVRSFREFLDAEKELKRKRALVDNPVLIREQREMDTEFFAKVPDKLRSEYRKKALESELKKVGKMTGAAEKRAKITWAHLDSLSEEERKLEVARLLADKNKSVDIRIANYKENRKKKAEASEGGTLSEADTAYFDKQEADARKELAEYEGMLGMSSTEREKYIAEKEEKKKKAVKAGKDQLKQNYFEMDFADQMAFDEEKRREVERKGIPKYPKYRQIVDALRSGDLLKSKEKETRRSFYRSIYVEWRDTYEVPLKWARIKKNGDGESASKMPREVRELLIAQQVNNEQKLDTWIKKTSARLRQFNRDVKEALGLALFAEYGIMKEEFDAEFDPEGYKKRMKDRAAKEKQKQYKDMDEAQAAETRDGYIKAITEEISKTWDPMFKDLYKNTLDTSSELSDRQIFEALEKAVRSYIEPLEARIRSEHNAFASAQFEKSNKGDAAQRAHDDYVDLANNNYKAALIERHVEAIKDSRFKMTDVEKAARVVHVKQRSRCWSFESARNSFAGIGAMLPLRKEMRSSSRWARSTGSSRTWSW